MTPSLPPLLTPLESTRVGRNISPWKRNTRETEHTGQTVSHFQRGRELGAVQGNRQSELSKIPIHLPVSISLLIFRKNFLQYIKNSVQLRRPMLIAVVGSGDQPLMPRDHGSALLVIPATQLKLNLTWGNDAAKCARHSLYDRAAAYPRSPAATSPVWSLQK